MKKMKAVKKQHLENLKDGLKQDITDNVNAVFETKMMELVYKVLRIKYIDHSEYGG